HRALPRYKDINKFGQPIAVDFADLHSEQVNRAALVGSNATDMAPEGTLIWLKALTETASWMAVAEAPVDPTRQNWVPLGPLAVRGGQPFAGPARPARWRQNPPTASGRLVASTMLFLLTSCAAAAGAGMPARSICAIGLARRLRRVP